MATAKHTVGILLFDDVEVLDFAGPFEVLSVTGTEAGDQPFAVATVARETGAVRARNGLRVMADYGFADAPRFDIAVVPGGFGTRALLDDADTLAWIRDQDGAGALTLSVCTGALLLGKAGLLDGLRATTHHNAFDLLRRCAPDAEVVEDGRIIDNGRIITSGGISAGIDMALYTVGRLCGPDEARRTAAYMEYDWRPADAKAA
ncbi:MAG: DJ-1/PfpI family protein [Alphaproteobacteria bacterium]|jgi:transcriptional regulator GlxA family with amidase domain|nr:DJ-1/PfpI family protein [Alphaproteobacteria bacterium]